MLLTKIFEYGLLTCFLLSVKVQQLSLSAIFHAFAEHALGDFEKDSKQRSICSGQDDGNIGTHPSNIWTQGMAERTHTQLSVDCVPGHGTQNQWAI